MGRKGVQVPTEVRLLSGRLRHPGDQKIGPASVCGKVSSDSQAFLLLQGVPEDGILSFFLLLNSGAVSTLQDWKRHKPFCKDDASRSSVDSVNAEIDKEDKEQIIQRATLSHDVTSDKFEGRAAGHGIDVTMKDGNIMRLTSETLGPKTMRGIRKFTEDNL
jgi:hypothetical protein